MGEKESSFSCRKPIMICRQNQKTLVNIRAITVSDENDQSVLNTVGKNLKSDEIFTLSQNIFLQHTYLEV